MRLAYINPNSTEAMTRSVVSVAQAAAPGATVVGKTNEDGPPAIQGALDGRKALPGLLDCVARASEAGADGIVIACFDDTGLSEAQSLVSCPVLGIGQSAYLTSVMLGLRFSVVTSTAVSLPVIEENIDRQQFRGSCVSVRASGLPVLTIEEGSAETLDTIAREICDARDLDGAEAVVLGCAGMAHLRDELAARTGVRLIDGVSSSALLALTVASLDKVNSVASGVRVPSGEFL